MRATMSLPTISLSLVTCASMPHRSTFPRGGRRERLSYLKDSRFSFALRVLLFQATRTI
jgi:hypothetical protein